MALLKPMESTNLDPIKQIPILDVATKLSLQLRGRKTMCFDGHDKRTPSLSFLPGRNTWKCFGCGKHGDSIGLVMEVLKCDFTAALAWFAADMRVDVRQHRTERRHRRRIGAYRTPPAVKASSVPLPETKEFSADSELFSWLIARCSAISQPEGLRYLKEHGISLEAAVRFGLRELREPPRAYRKIIEHWGKERLFRSGLAWGDHGRPDKLIWPSYSVLFPFYSAKKVEYIQGRLFQGDRKYVNPRGISKPLFNAEQLRTLSPGTILHVCEGIPDAIALEARGFHAVAVLGASSFRPEWVDLLKRHDVVLMPDGDQGGATFKRTISGFFKARGISVRAIQMPPGKDVADLIAEMRRSHE